MINTVPRKGGSRKDRACLANVAGEAALLMGSRTPEILNPVPIARCCAAARRAKEVLGPPQQYALTQKLLSGA